MSDIPTATNFCSHTHTSERLTTNPLLEIVLENNLLKLGVVSFYLLELFLVNHFLLLFVVAVVFVQEVGEAAVADMEICKSDLISHEVHSVPICD